MPEVLPEARCRVCREALTPTGLHEPWCLACGHTVCAACRPLCNGNSNSNDSPAVCPLCRVATDAPPCRNIQLAELIAALAAAPAPAPVPVPAPAPVPVSVYVPRPMPVPAPLPVPVPLPRTVPVSVARPVPLSVALPVQLPIPRPAEAPRTIASALATPPPPPPWLPQPAETFLPQLNTPSATDRKTRVLRHRTRHSAPAACPLKNVDCDVLLRQESSAKIPRRV